MPGSLGGTLEARSAVAGSSEGGPELARSRGGGRGGPDERSALAAASAFAAIAPSVAARWAPGLTGCSQPCSTAPVSFATPRRDDGGSGIAPRSAGEVDARAADGDEGRAGRGGTEAWAPEPLGAAGLDSAGVFPPRGGLAEAASWLAELADDAGDEVGEDGGAVAGDAGAESAGVAELGAVLDSVR